MNSKISCEEVLQRLAEFYKTKTDADLASKLGVAKQTISTWRGRNRIPYELLVDISLKERISLDFLVFGESDGEFLNKKNQIDIDIFNDILEYIYSDECELKGMRLEAIIGDVVDIYNSIIDCESDIEKDRLLKAQLKLLNKWAKEEAIKNLEGLRIHFEGDVLQKLQSDIDALKQQVSDMDDSREKK